MPVGAIKGPDAEKVWERAVAQADKGYPGLKSSNPDKFYAITMTIYKKMCTKHNCSPKAEGLGSLIRKLELLSEGGMARVNVKAMDVEALKGQIIAFHRRYRVIADMLWEDGTNRNSPGYVFLREHPEIERKWEKFRGAFDEFLKSIWTAGKYLDVKVAKPRGAFEDRVEESSTFTGVAMALDRAVVRARRLADTLRGKGLSVQRSEVRDQLHKYADELLQIAKEFEA